MRALQVVAAFALGFAVAVWWSRMRAAAMSAAGAIDTTPEVAAAETPNINGTAIQGIVPLDEMPTAPSATASQIAAATGGALVGNGLRLFA